MSEKEINADMLYKQLEMALEERQRADRRRRAATSESPEGAERRKRRGRRKTDH